MKVSTSNIEFLDLYKERNRLKWNYNNRTELEYKKYGLVTPDNLDFQIKNFLAKVDPKGKFLVTRSVKKIVRLKAIDFDDKHNNEQ